MGEPTSEALMEQSRAGDAGAFAALYDRHAPAVLAYVERVMCDDAAAEDVLQATFLSVLRSGDRYRAGAPFVPWLFSIATNAARDGLRRRSRRREESGPVPETPSRDATSDPALAKRLREALESLPLPQREAVVLRHVYEWSFDEMSEALGTNVATLRVRAHRGNDRLRELLADVWKGE